MRVGCLVKIGGTFERQFQDKIGIVIQVKASKLRPSFNVYWVLLEEELDAFYIEDLEEL